MNAPKKYLKKRMVTMENYFANAPKNGRKCTKKLKEMIKVSPFMFGADQSLKL